MKTPECAIVKVSVCGIYADATFKSEMVNQALLREELLILDKKDNWYQISLKHDGYKGWVHSMYLAFQKKQDNIVEYALELLGKPYLWGGRSHQGYDCSGLIQTCMNLAGYTFPRDTKDQIQSELLYEVQIQDIKVQDLLFFKETNKVSHVGIAKSNFDNNKLELIHSSGFVRIDVIDLSDTPNIKILSSKRKLKLHKIMRLKSNA